MSRSLKKAPFVEEKLYARICAMNEKGESIISYADYAMAMVDEITEGSHIQERISVVRK